MLLVVQRRQRPARPLTVAGAAAGPQRPGPAMAAAMLLLQAGQAALMLLVVQRRHWPLPLLLLMLMLLMWLLLRKAARAWPHAARAHPAAAACGRTLYHHGILAA